MVKKGAYLPGYVDGIKSTVKNHAYCCDCGVVKVTGPDRGRGPGFFMSVNRARRPGDEGSGEGRQRVVGAQGDDEGMHSSGIEGYGKIGCMELGDISLGGSKEAET